MCAILETCLCLAVKYVLAVLLPLLFTVIIGIGVMLCCNTYLRTLVIKFYDPWIKGYAFIIFVFLSPLIECLSVYYRATENKFFFTLISAMLTFFFYLGYGYKADLCRVPHILAAFERGTPRPEKIHYFVDRPEIKELAQTFASPITNKYMVIFGERGTGKTILLKHACHEVGPGVVYISVPVDPTEFPDVFATAIDFPFDEGTSLWRAFLYAVGIAPNLGMFYIAAKNFGTYRPYPSVIPTMTY